MAKVSISGYVKKTKTGKTVHVSPYMQTRDLLTNLLNMPGRPPTSSKSASYPRGRSVPGPAVAKLVEQIKAHESQQRVSALKQQAANPQPTKKTVAKKAAAPDTEAPAKKAAAPATKKTTAKKAAAAPAKRSGSVDTSLSSETKEEAQKSVTKAVDKIRKPTKQPVKKEEAKLPDDTTKWKVPPITETEFQAHVAQLKKRLGKAISEGKETDKMFGVKDENGKYIEGVWTPERTRVHDQIIHDILSAHSDVPKERKAIVSGGLGGSGKGFLLKKYAGVPEGSRVVIDPDEMKQVLIDRGLTPEVEGIEPMEMAALIHEESSHLAKRLAKAAYQEGYNVTFDTTMGNGPSARKKIEEMQKAGYEVEGIFADVPVEVSVTSALGRYKGGLNRQRNGIGSGGRYVPVEIIRQQRSDNPDVWSQNREIFDGLSKMFTRARVYDNSDRTGEVEPKLLVDTGKERKRKQKAATKTTSEALENLNLAAQRLTSVNESAIVRLSRIVGR